VLFNKGSFRCEHCWLDFDFWRKTTGADLWNATLRGKGAECLMDALKNKSNVEEMTARCYTQPYAYAYNDVPTFVVQSMVDTANLGFCYKMPCGLKGSTDGSCSKPEVSSILEFAEQMKSSIMTAQAQHGSRDSKYPYLFLVPSPCRVLRRTLT
jgi:hypothetical protein